MNCYALKMKIDGVERSVRIDEKGDGCVSKSIQYEPCYGGSFNFGRQWVCAFLASTRCKREIYIKRFLIYDVCIN